MPAHSRAAAVQRAPVQAAHALPAAVVVQQQPAQRATGSLPGTKQQQQQQQEQDSAAQDPACLHESTSKGATPAAAAGTGSAHDVPVSQPSVASTAGQNGIALSSAERTPSPKHSTSTGSLPDAVVAREAPQLTGRKRREQASSSVSKGGGPAPKKQAAAPVGQHFAAETGLFSHAQDGRTPHPGQPLEPPVTVTAAPSAEAQAAGVAAVVDPAEHMEGVLVWPASVPDQAAARGAEPPPALQQIGSETVPGKAETTNGNSPNSSSKARKVLGPCGWAGRIQPCQEGPHQPDVNVESDWCSSLPNSRPVVCRCLPSNDCATDWRLYVHVYVPCACRFASLQ